MFGARPSSGVDARLTFLEEVMSLLQGALVCTAVAIGCMVPNAVKIVHERCSSESNRVWPQVLCTVSCFFRSAPTPRAAEPLGARPTGCLSNPVLWNFRADDSCRCRCRWALQPRRLCPNLRRLQPGNLTGSGSPRHYSRTVYAMECELLAMPVRLQGVHAV